ncbi:DUF2442 domain-containing protein [bacterium]|nr:DUF2442 domain-containing protein [bacterium]
MSSKIYGKSTSISEVTAITNMGFWIWADNREFFVLFDDYPRFKNATASQIFNIQFTPPDHFYWEELDVDIELSALINPDNYPLSFKDH